MRDQELSKRAEEIQKEFPDALKYKFKFADEAAWFILIAVFSVIAQELLTFDANAITDWRTWVLALASASIRAAAGGFLAYKAKDALS